MHRRALPRFAWHGAVAISGLLGARSPAPKAEAVGGPWTSGGPGAWEVAEVVISEEELRRHNQLSDAWISFNGNVYDITAYVAKHPPCTGGLPPPLRWHTRWPKGVVVSQGILGLNWAQRVAGRRFEDFLGRDAFGPAHLGCLAELSSCGPDANCSKGVKAERGTQLAAVIPQLLRRFEHAQGWSQADEP
eukprot:Skav226058  [mRNA]  locus=scaffold211:326116:328765:- [translate_table: standard]